MSQGIRDLNKGNFKKVVEGETKTVLVDFWAPWCGPCRAITSELEAAATELNGSATIAKVNVDEEPELAEFYGVQSIPNLIIFKEGKPVRQLIGFHNRKMIVEAVS